MLTVAGYPSAETPDLPTLGETLQSVMERGKSQPLPDAAVQRGEEAEGSEQDLAIFFVGFPPLPYLF